MYFYIPPFAGVCYPHVVQNDWEELIAQRAIHDFNSAHVLDIIDLYKCVRTKQSIRF